MYSHYLVSFIVFAALGDAFRFSNSFLGELGHASRSRLACSSKQAVHTQTRLRHASRVSMSEVYDSHVPRPKPVLDIVEYPADLKKLSMPQLKQLSEELRWEVIESVSKTGGHLSSSLGVTELTVALHYVFDAPEDKIVWDVAHQCYPHKMLTGRRHRFNSLRQWKGISGFTKRSESE